jgi:ABC-2 type transport system ATP-binding protein
MRILNRSLAVRTDNLSKTYRNQKGKPVLALQRLNLSIQPGEIFGLLGPNGAGKTTLVRILATLLRATEGHATVDGYDVVRDEHQVRARIGYAGQDSERSAYFRLTVRENLIYFGHALRAVPISTVRERMDEITSAIGFTEQLDQHFSTLSGGQKQLVIVIRALLHQPNILFLDEPSKSLDPVTAERVRTFLVDFARDHEMSVLLTTHNMAEAEEICDRIGFINKGHLQFVGTPREFRRTVTVQEMLEITPLAAPVDTLTGSESVAEQLEKLPGVSHIAGNGTLRLYCDDGFEVLCKAMTLLQKAGVRASVSMVEPSLEDAFSIFVSNGEEATGDN